MPSNNQLIDIHRLIRSNMMKTVKYLLTIMSVLVVFQVHAEDGVARAAFTTEISEHEPVDEISELTNDTSKIYYFTEIKGLEGQTLTHRWELNGEIQASVSIPIGGNRWRIWSSKNLNADATGEWKVTVLDEAGSQLSEKSFNYVAANTESAEAKQTIQKTVNIAEEDLHKIAPSAGGKPAESEASTKEIQ
jgi:Protein of unknown function (DUF2914)